MKRLVVVLLLMSLASFTGCGAKEIKEPGDLGTMTVGEDNSISHVKEIETIDSSFTSMYKDLGTFDNVEELKEVSISYIKEVKDAILEEGVFSNATESDNESSYSLQGFDSTMRFAYNLFCHVDGYQGVQMACTLYPSELDDWDNYDWTAVLQNVEEYTSVNIDIQDLNTARQEIVERISEGDSYSVAIESPNKDTTVTLHCMEYGDTYECWTLDVFNLVSPGENFYSR